MQIVLLSGGSGKRLWPLSNNARSKQFLPLLSKDDGSMESMVQRVVGQLRAAGLSENICFATNNTQLDVITNQLGEGISAVCEPQRRDTFPAIALASSFLKYSKGCPDNETVVIMPCDPYTEAGYFKTIGKMIECVEQNVAELVLMGISPSYPSEKYGYVVPSLDPTEPIVRSKGGLIESEGKIDYKLVSQFTEKPNTERAKQLLEMGALWNGGVFAFKLGYLIEIVHKYIESTSFEEIRSRYEEFPKISFDYEVAEKAKSVAVVPFKGKWKDLGTWNTLTEELNKPIIGNAVMGPHCKNTHIVNELQHPIFVDGLNDCIVAASPDGIIVCKKEYSEDIKSSVEKLSDRPMYEERRWGTYRVIDDSSYADGHQSLTKSIKVNAGKSISYQLHRHRSEVWTFVEGEGLFVLDGQTKKVKAGDAVVIPPGACHGIKAITPLSFIEVQSGKPLIEEDTERFNWNWEE